MTDKIPPSKIFGIGLNKTGTTTLGQCGKILGYRCKSCDRALLADFMINKDFSRIHQTVSQYDFFEDWPWPLIYKELDQRYPGSKFILTVRKNPETWLRSLKTHSMKTHPLKHCRKLAYGYNYPHGHEKTFIEFYEKHNEETREYFKNRNHDFLELCWEKGDGFEKLCTFLGKENPGMPLPHAYKSSEHPGRLHRLILNRLFSLIPE